MKKRVAYFDILKLLGCLAVIVIHVVSMYWYDLPIKSNNFTWLSIIDSLTRWAVPIYFMVSGALFLNEDKKITIKDLFLKYIFKIFLIFITWNMLYGILDMIIINKNFNFSLLLQKFISTLSGTPEYHLWFLIVIIGFYLCVPILKLITKKENKKIIEYLLIILFIFTSLIYTLRMVFPFRIGYSILFGEYIIYFILGYYLHNFKLKEKTKCIIYILGFVGLLITAIGTIVYCRLNNTYSEIFFDNLSINVLFMSAAVFLFCKDHFKDKELIKNKIIKSISDNYFGIYLIHGLVIGFYQKIGFFNVNMFLPALTIILVALVFISSYFGSFIIGKIPFVKKIIKL